MGKVSGYMEAKRNKDKDKALKLHKQGFTLREIGVFMGKSYEWARVAIKERLTKLDKSGK